MDIFVVPDITNLSQLCKIMNKYGSDKSTLFTEGRNWHNYTLYYNELFKSFKLNIKRVFELGLGTNNIDIKSNMGIDGKPGASLRGWKDYFENASIFGADIDKSILFNEDRIETFYCDQLSPTIIKDMWSSNSLQENFDIIIDDGLHTFEANKCFFENSIHKLVVGGVFIIEDILNEDVQKFMNILPEWCKKYNLEYNLLKLPHFRNVFDNTLLVLQKI